MRGGKSKVVRLAEVVYFLPLDMVYWGRGGAVAVRITYLKGDLEPKTKIKIIWKVTLVAAIMI